MCDDCTQEWVSIYKLTDPRTEKGPWSKYVYIGQTMGSVENRVAGHVREAVLYKGGTCSKSEWLYSLHKLGLQPEVTILDGGYLCEASTKEAIHARRAANEGKLLLNKIMPDRKPEHKEGRRVELCVQEYVKSPIYAKAEGFVRTSSIVRALQEKYSLSEEIAWAHLVKLKMVERGQTRDYHGELLFRLIGVYPPLPPHVQHTKD